MTTSQRRIATLQHVVLDGLLGLLRTVLSLSITRWFLCWLLFSSQYFLFPVSCHPRLRPNVRPFHFRITPDLCPLSPQPTASSAKPQGVLTSTSTARLLTAKLRRTPWLSPYPPARRKPKDPPLCSSRRKGGYRHHLTPSAFCFLSVYLEFCVQFVFCLLSTGIYFVSLTHRGICWYDHANYVPNGIYLKHLNCDCRLHLPCSLVSLFTATSSCYLLAYRDSNYLANPVLK